MLYVVLGAPLGAMLRYLVSQKLNGAFPFGTLMINLLGALLLGFVARLDQSMMLLLGTGFLGAFTTFSTFNVEIVQLFKERRLAAIVYLSLSYIIGPLLFLFAFTFQF
ncbi:fluoride efflux transporter CrcB [Macrococcus animalis]|uniref:fluoride efflux transporter CrcB n=1 Tax=Macrococcus animalis TaxID=3395467 RepID=UPI0039BDE138